MGNIERYLKIFALLGICYLLTWLFFYALKSGLKTGILKTKYGDINRHELSIMFWSIVFLYLICGLMGFVGSIVLTFMVIVGIL